MNNRLKSALKGSVGDHFFISGDFLSKSRNRKGWNTQLASLIFQGGDGNHIMDVTGRNLGASWLGYENNFSWGLLELDSGQSLDLITKNGFGHAALYIGTLELADGISQLADIDTKHVNIYYDAEMNPWLGDEVYPLSGGGKLIPVDGDDPLAGNFQAVVDALPEPGGCGGVGDGWGGCGDAATLAGEIRNYLLGDIGKRRGPSDTPLTIW